MTFAELRDLTRKEIIVDEYDDAFDDADINNALWRASFEIAAAFDFPRKTATIADVPADAVSASAPADCAKIHTLSLAVANSGNDDARPADVQKVLRFQSWTARPIRYFNFDPRREESILFAPPTRGGTITIIYTAWLTRPTPASFDAAEPWEGLLKQFHPMIVYRAGVALFQSEEREDETQPWKDEYQARAQELAAFLGRTNLGTLMVEAQLRNDQGAQS